MIVLITSVSEITDSVAQNQTATPLPKHTYPYLIGAKNGLAAAKVGRYTIGGACTPFTDNDLNHCIAGYFDTITGYHDAKVTYMPAMKILAGKVNITKNNSTNATGSKVNIENNTLSSVKQSKYRDAINTKQPNSPPDGSSTSLRFFWGGGLLANAPLR